MRRMEGLAFSGRVMGVQQYVNFQSVSHRHSSTAHRMAFQEAKVLPSSDLMHSWEHGRNSLVKHREGTEAQGVKPKHPG